MGAEKLEGVPLWVPSKEGLEEKPVGGWWLPAREAALVLCPLSLKELDRLPASVGFWTLASKWVIEALSRQQVVPSIEDGDAEGTWLASWRVAPVRPEDRARLAGLAAAMPGVARASRAMATMLVTAICRRALSPQPAVAAGWRASVLLSAGWPCS